MSSVTSVFVVIGDSPDGLAEDVAPKVAEAIAAFTGDAHMPVISYGSEGWDALQGGKKAAGGAVIWFGWNYGQPNNLETHLKGLGFAHVTVWSQREHGGSPRVTTW